MGCNKSELYIVFLMLQVLVFAYHYGIASDESCTRGACIPNDLKAP